MRINSFINKALTRILAGHVIRTPEQKVAVMVVSGLAGACTTIACKLAKLTPRQTAGVIVVGGIAVTVLDNLVAWHQGGSTYKPARQWKPKPTRYVVRNFRVLTVVPGGDA